MIVIDGSYGEGGGQILRNAIAFSVLFDKKVKINNIRSNRPNPGIKPQHYTCIDIIKQIEAISNYKLLKVKISKKDLNLRFL